MSKVKLRSQPQRHVAASGVLVSRAAKPPTDSTKHPSLEWAQYLGLDEADEVEAVPADVHGGETPVSALSPLSEVASTSNAPTGIPSSASSVKRKASNDNLSELPSKSSRLDDRMGDTIIINGEIYDRRRRPGSIAGLQLLNTSSSSHMEGPTDTFSLPDVDSYRSPPSPSVVSTTLDATAYRMRRRPALNFGSEVSFATGVNASSNSVVGLTSPTGNLSLSSPPRTSRTIPKSRHLANELLRSLSSDNYTSFATDFQSECGSSIREASPEGIRIVSPKAKKARKRAPAKGTPQAAMGTDETGEPIHIARPPNAWILYRSDQLRIIKNDPVISKKPQADISKLIGALWREEKAEVKLWYEQQAEVKKEEHLRAHPGSSRQAFS
jgi:hypothetical protein